MNNLMITTPGNDGRRGRQGYRDAVLTNYRGRESGLVKPRAFRVQIEPWLDRQEDQEVAGTDSDQVLTSLMLRSIA